MKKLKSQRQKNNKVRVFCNYTNKEETETIESIDIDGTSTKIPMASGSNNLVIEEKKYQLKLMHKQ